MHIWAALTLHVLLAESQICPDPHAQLSSHAALHNAYTKDGMKRQI